MQKLFFKALLCYLCGLVLTAALIFLPAGTLSYPAAWRLLAALFLPMLIAGLVLMRKNPTLLESRLNAREKLGAQKKVVGLSALMFIAGFVAAGLSHRFHFLLLPDWISHAALIVFLLSYLLYGEVLRENTWLSRTIEVQKGQSVVDTGLYSVIRHPMYSATLLLFLSMPLVLGSLAALLPFLFYPALIIARIRSEEAFLTSSLPGYAEYKTRIRYRLIPFIW